MSRSIKNVIRKRAMPYSITRFDRSGGYYDDNDGLWVDDEQIPETVKIHLQPINDQITDGPEAQRSLIQWRGWAVDESGNEVANKDRVTVGTGVYTIADLQWWPGEYREFNLVRSGESENVSDT